MPCVSTIDTKIQNNLTWAGNLYILKNRMTSLPKAKACESQILLSLLVSIAVFAILGHTIFTLISASYSIVTFTRARITALHLASERVELIRNLPYDSIGIIGGIPAGNMQPNENVTRNGLNYIVKTSIVYIDDPFDNVAPIDLLPTDYKRVRVDVSWEGLVASKKNPVTLITDIAPRGVESTQGGGTLSILVFDANGQPVPQADVNIIATQTSPQVNLNLQTSDNGRIILPGSPTCTSCYQITVTKEGYSSDRTYSTAEVVNPDKPYLSVIESLLTEVSFLIDKTSELTIKTVSFEEDYFSELGNVTFFLRGGKTLGTDFNDELVYKFENVYTTNSQGEVRIQDLEWDDFTIFLLSDSDYSVSGFNPLLPLVVLPNTVNELVFSLDDFSLHNLLVSFTNASGEPIASVSALLSDNSGFEATGSSGISENPNFGQIFFDNLTNKIYQLKATVSGYLDYEGNVSVGGNTKDRVILNSE